MTDKEKLKKLKKLADAMYYAAQHLTTDASRLHKAMNEYHQFIIHECNEEPVSEDLDIAIGEYCSNPDNFITYIDVAFAYRSEQKDDIPLIIKAIKFGAQWKEQQMMAKAINVEVRVDAGGYPYTPEIELYDYDKDVPLAKKRDRYKVILIKEDE